MSESEDKKRKENINIDSNKPKQDKNYDLNESSENESDKEEPNFDTIDFNINPFNSQNDSKKRESDDFTVKQKEDDKLNKNNSDINGDIKLNSEISDNIFNNIFPIFLNNGNNLHNDNNNKYMINNNGNQNIINNIKVQIIQI